MKQCFVSPNAVARWAICMVAVSLAFGCGGKFQTQNPQAAEVRPPATSDPDTAEDMRRLEAQQNNEILVEPVLETDEQRTTFYQDMMEQPHTFTDEQLAADAEAQFNKREKERQAKLEKDTAPSHPQKPPPTSVPPVPETPPTAAPGKAPLPAEPAKATVPKAPPASVRSEFCDTLNVTSGKGEANLSMLYNSNATLIKVMPSQDLEATRSQEKKNRFVCALLPVAIRMNEEVFRQRLEVLRLQNKQKKNIALNKDDEVWLANMKSTYGISADGDFAELLKRVDIIPLPLLLAQAAIESGWGTSNATVKLNNIFGMHASRGQPCQPGYDKNNACMREFKTLGEGVSAYIRLLNTGKYYPKFRDARAKMRTDGKALDSEELLKTLHNYNETPGEYVKMVRQIMTGSNKLTQFVFNENEVESASKAE